MAKRALILAAGGLVLVIAALAGGFYERTVAASNPPEAPADYGDAGNWVCRPGRADDCAADLGATAIAADGATSVVPALPAGDPKIDCFYVYPTVSRARTENAPLALSDEVAEVARVQFARFRGVCRTYAPIYRQTTLQALKASAIGIGGPGDRELAYADVRDAWRSYLARDNGGRGFVLVGHSQGSRLLKRLIQEEIEGRPVQARLVSALLIGNGVVVPSGRDVGGDFKRVTLCRAAGQIGCVIAYSSFRASAPPPADSRYGRNPGNGFDVSCTNPAALGGGAAMLDGYFPARPWSVWADPPVSVGTPFVTLPGLISGACVHDAASTYLAISFNGRPGDRRRNDIAGDVVVMGHVLAGWGLHPIDVNVALGDLVRVVGVQGAAFVRGGASR
jgi:hypothetical protein